MRANLLSCDGMVNVDVCKTYLSEFDSQQEIQGDGMFADKLFSKNIIQRETGCWEWQGSPNNMGYGKTKRRKLFGNKDILVHRYAWYLKYGIIPDVCVLHKCDNPICVNPEHLFLGTIDDNNKDRHKKGRSRGGSMGNRKLSDEDVRQIKDMIISGMSNTSIALNFDITHSTVSSIRVGKSWKNIG